MRKLLLEINRSQSQKIKKGLLMILLEAISIRTFRKSSSGPKKRSVLEMLYIINFLFIFEKFIGFYK